MFEPSSKMLQDQDIMTISLMSNLSDKIKNKITPASFLNTEEAIDFYHKEYKNKLKRSLTNYYSISCQLFPNNVDAMFNDYVKIKSSDSYNLYHFCEGFLDYLRSSPWFEQYPNVFGLINLELCFNKLQYSAPEKGLDQDKISEIGVSEDITVDFIDNLFLFKSEYPIYDWWKEHSLEIKKKPSHFFIYKTHKDINIFHLSNFQYQIVFNMVIGKTIEVSIQEAYSNMTEEKKKSEITVLFSYLSTNRLIAGLHY